MSFSDANASTPLLSGSPALLALKRFIRNILRPAGIVLVSLFVFLNIGAHLHAMPLSGVESQPDSSARSAQQSVWLAAPAVSGHVLSANMTHHHLTSARLSIPAVPGQAITHIANAQ